MTQFKSGSAFVRTQPVDLPTKEVAALAAKEGLKVSLGLVRLVRFNMRHRSAKVVKRVGPPSTTTAIQVRRGRPSNNHPPVKETTVMRHPHIVTREVDRMEILFSLIMNLGTAQVRSALAKVESLVA
jgi:hypothetical protein